MGEPEGRIDNQILGVKGYSTTESYKEIVWFKLQGSTKEQEKPIMKKLNLTVL